MSLNMKKGFLIKNTMSNNNTKTQKEKRSREWVFILYPESAPENWKKILKELKIVYVISPLHNKDVNEEGELKKEHYHILLSFNSVKSFSQIQDITDRLNQPKPQICHNKTAQIRYFIHLDDPDKYQYDRKDIETYGQIDLDTYFKFTVDEELQIVDDILDYCDINNIEEFFQLVDFVRKNNRDWFRYINKNSWLIKEYLKSKHFHKKEKALTTKTDFDCNDLITQIEE